MLTPALAVVLAVAPLDLGPSCKASKKEVGSLHAATSFEVQMEAPKSKAKQPLECDGKAVTLFVSEYGTQASLDAALNLTGPQLWGGPGPSAEHSDELMSKGLVAVVASGPGVAAAAKALAAKGFTAWRAPKADSLERLASALDCKDGSKDPLRVWCAAVQAKGSGFTSPSAPATWLGLTVPLNDSKDVRDTILKGTRVSALSFNGGKVSLQDVAPENDDERKQLAEVAAGLAAVLKGADKGPVKVKKDLAGYLTTLTPGAAKSGHAVKDDPKGATVPMKMPSKLYRLKFNGVDTLVLTEEAGDGMWVNIYPMVGFTAG